MQIQIRNQVAVDAQAAGTEETVSLRFITATGHEAAVELTGELVSELLEKLKAFAPEPAPPRPSLRELLGSERSAAVRLSNFTGQITASWRISLRRKQVSYTGIFALLGIPARDRP